MVLEVDWPQLDGFHSCGFTQMVAGQSVGIFLQTSSLTWLRERILNQPGLSSGTPHMAPPRACPPHSMPAGLISKASNLRES